MSNSVDHLKKNQSTETLIAVMQSDLSHMQETMKAIHEEMRAGFLRLETGLVSKTAHDALEKRVNAIESNQSWAVRQIVGPLLGGLALIVVIAQQFIK